MRDGRTRRRLVQRGVTGAVLLSLLVPSFALPVSATAHSTSRKAAHEASHVDVPLSPVGKQLTWLLGVGALLPLSRREESDHFDAAFVAAEPVAQLNEALASLGSSGSQVTLLKLSDVTTGSLVAVVQIGRSTFDVRLGVDGTGLIAGLYFSLAAPVPIPKVTSWTQVTGDLKKMAPHASFLVARLGAGGTCAALHSVDANTPRPLGSMFKLFVLGALANAVKAHHVRWDEKLTVSAAIKVGGSGVLQGDPNGTVLSVEQVATAMIAESDNTAADLLMTLVGRSAVEAQVRAWSSHASLDSPFLSVAELFALKWHDFPVLAEHYLSLTPAQRLAYLETTVDKVPVADITTSSSPRDVNAIEWFASPRDVCRAFSGLSALASEPGLAPLNTILSTNNGGIELQAAKWPRVWFKGGSEPGVLTLGYLARSSSGTTFVVVEMLENTTRALATSSTLLGLGVVTGALDLVRH